MSTNALEVHNLSFAYPSELTQGSSRWVLRDLSFELAKGDFAVISGATGSGKTSFLRLLKPELAPAGRRTGSISCFGVLTEELSAQESLESIAYVSQNPDNQIVCDSVWHELAFGLENLALKSSQIALRIAETCNFLGMQSWFYARTAELSGGQKALVNLASALVMRPKILLLDEPTSQLDPVSEKEFLSLLYRVNQELGVSVCITSHRPFAYRPYATSFYSLENGRLQKTVPPQKAPQLCERLVNYSPHKECILKAQDLWYRYSRDDDWVLRNLNFELFRGEVRSLLGANASGKTTLLLALTKALSPQRGSISCTTSKLVYLPQNPKALFAKDSLERELAEWAHDSSAVDQALSRLGFLDAKERHPYDLSGGEQQLLALEKLLMLEPEVLLLDEPTKGLDDTLRTRLAQRIAELASANKSVLIATHDIAFTKAVSHSCTLLFAGSALSSAPLEDFFAETWTYQNE